MDRNVTTTDGTILKQVNRMVAFIELEGVEKAEAIINKTEEEYHLLVGNLVQNGRRQLVELYDKKIKMLAKENNLKAQILSSQSKMNLYSHRQKIVNDVLDEVLNKLNKNADDEAVNKDVLYKCMLQSFVTLLETDVIVQVIERDKEIVKDIVPRAQKEFEEITGKKLRIKIAKKCLPNKNVGGCVVFNRRCSLKVTNTISERFRIILERVVVTMLRALLFGLKTLNTQ